MQTLEDWLKLTSTGDKQAFKQLYNASSPRLYALCRRLLRDEGLAQDALQEGFIKIWQNANQYMPAKASAMTWMSTIMRNHVLDKLRSQTTQVSTTSLTLEDDETLELLSHALQPEQLHSLSEDAQQLWWCLNQLKPEQRESIVIAFFHGKTHEQLAHSLGKPLGTIKAWIRRGLEQLRGCLQ